MKDKKKLIIIIAFILIIAVAACAVYFVFFRGDKEPTLSETVETRIAAYETDLTDSLASMTDQDSVTKYLVNWAETKSIVVKQDRYDNVIYSIPATAGGENQKPAVIVCGYNYNCMESYVNSIVSALTVAKTDTAHGNLTIIFVSEATEDINDIEKLSNEYFTDNTEVFYLGNVSGSRIAQATGGYNEYTISKSYKEVKPSYNKAYQISITGMPAENFDSKSVTMPNPIKNLGNLLATLKSNSIMFELASFTGGQAATVTPSAASLTIVVNDDATSKLESRLNSAIEKFNDKYAEKYPDASYTYKVVDIPSKVVNSEDTERIVSLMYTLINGVQSKDEDDNAASITNVGYISIQNKKINIEAAASSYDDSLLAETAESYQTISALSDVNFEITASSPVFTVNDAGKQLANDFLSSYSAYKKTELDLMNMAEYTPCAAISKKNENMALIALGVTDKTKDNFAGALIIHMQPEE